MSNEPSHPDIFRYLKHRLLEKAKMVYSCHSQNHTFINGFFLFFTGIFLKIITSTPQDDLDLLLEKLRLPAAEFPVTHSQRGGHSSSEDVVRKYYSTLLKSDVLQLYDMYRLDHELFGYSPDKFLDYAQ
jgi:hypothetical protein